jgi:microcin C transport system permease protein
VDPKRLEQIKACTASTNPRTSASGDMLAPVRAFDLGKSFFQNKDVWELVSRSCRCRSAWACGRFSSATWWRCRWAWPRRCGPAPFDLVTTLLVLVGYAIPGFVLGVALLVVFGGQLQWFPCAG